MSEKEKRTNASEYYYILLMLLLMLLASCSDGASVQGSTAAEQPRTELSTGVVFSPESIPEWSEVRDQILETSFGEVRIFNASKYEIDLALLKELIQAYGKPLHKSLELRVFNDSYVVPSPDGFNLSNKSGLIGLTVSSENVVWVVIPTGWVSSATRYTSTCTGENLFGDAVALITTDTLHELFGHGFKRASGEPSGGDDEECRAQDLEGQIIGQLNGRDLVR